MRVFYVVLAIAFLIIGILKGASGDSNVLWGCLILGNLMCINAKLEE